MLNYAIEDLSIGEYVENAWTPPVWAGIRARGSSHEILHEGKARGKSSSPKNRWKEVFIKSPNNPIISPNLDNYWEAYQTFNPGAIILDGIIHIIYRAIGIDWISRFGYASSADGVLIDERSSTPAYQSNVSGEGSSFSISGGGYGGCEDPRLVMIDNVIYMTYNIFGSRSLRIGFTSISMEDFISRRWSREKIISDPSKINKNFVLFPEMIGGDTRSCIASRPEYR